MTLPFDPGALQFRVIDVPMDQADDGPAVAWARMLPVLAMSHAAGQDVACAWLRVRPRDRVGVFGGGSMMLSGTEDEQSVHFPAGARGSARDASKIRHALEGLPVWRRVEITIDTGAQGSAMPTPIDEMFALMTDACIGYFALAHPCSRSQASPLMDKLSDQVDQLERMRTGRGSQRLRLEQAENRLKYLDSSLVPGLWELEVWTGGRNKQEADSIASLLTAGMGEDEPPLRLRPASAAPTTKAIYDSGLDWTDRCLVGSDAVSWLVRPPSRELVGLRMVETPFFDVSPEHRGDLHLGRVLDGSRSESLNFTLEQGSVNRHVFVTGATGSGKSQTTRTLLDSLAKAGVPWLVIEPAKAEYAGLAGRVQEYGAEVVAIRPGQIDAPPAGLNPLEPSVFVRGRSVYRFPIQTHLDMVRSLFTAAFDAQEPFPQILASSLTRCYEGLGWNLAVGKVLGRNAAIDPRWPTLSDLQAEALTVVSEIGYSKDIADNVRGFVKVRIDSLRLGTPGRFFEGGHRIDMEQLLAENIVFEIEDLGDDNDKAFFIGTVLIRVFEYLRLRKQFGIQSSGLHHVMVIEEAHRLLKKVEEASPAAQAVTMFANLLAEVRAYGEGIVVAEQIPSKVIVDVVKNSAVKLVHRLPAQEDRDLVGGTMNLDDRQSCQVVAFDTGIAAAHVDGMDRPVAVKIDAGRQSLEKTIPGVRPPIHKRSRSCPQWCEDSPCLLEQLAVSRSLERGSEIQLWAELVALGHLLGEPHPALNPIFRTELLRVDRHRLRCAIGLYVDEAVDRRSAFVRQCYDPDALKKRVLETMSMQLKSATPPGFLGPQWQFAQFRWADILRKLSNLERTIDPSKPHPETALWAARGLDLTSANCAEQLSEVRRAGHDLRADAREALGGRPMVLDELAVRIVGGPISLGAFKSAAAAIGFNEPWTWYWVKDLFPSVEGGQF